MVTGILLYLAFIRLLHSDYHIEGGAMLLTASIAVCANMLYVPVWSGRQVGSRVRERVFFQDGNTHARMHALSSLGVPEKEWERDTQPGGIC